MSFFQDLFARTPDQLPTTSSSEKKRLAAQKLIDRAASEEDLAYRRTRMPEAIQIRDAQVKVLEARIVEKVVNAGRRSELLAQLESMQIAITSATDAHGTSATNLRTAIASADGAAILSEQQNVTQWTLSIYALKQTASEISDELNAVPLEEDDEDVTELEAQRDAMLEASPLALADVLIKLERDHESFVFDEQMKFASQVPYVSQETRDRLRAEQQAAIDKQIQSTRYVVRPGDL